MINGNRDENFKWKKDKNLSPHDYLEVLQREYIVAELRKKIYPSKGDREFWIKIMGYKQEKIDDISVRNNLPTMFNNKKEKERLYRDVYNESGYPNFKYRDHERIAKDDRLSLPESDFINYYLVDSEVKVVEDDQVKIGFIKMVDLDSEVATIKFKNTGLTQEVNFQEITRVL